MFFLSPPQVKIHVSKQHHADRSQHLQRHWLLRGLLQHCVVIVCLGRVLSLLFPLLTQDSSPAVAVRCMERSSCAQAFAEIQGCTWTWGHAHGFAAATCLPGCRQGFASNKTRFCCSSAFYNLVTKTENIFVAGAYPIIFHGLMSWGGALFRGGGHG